MISHNSIEQELVTIVSRKTGKVWLSIVLLASIGLLFGVYALYQTLYNGIGTWGVNNYVAWGTAITNFVWWIGIAHAGTFISAILLLFRQPWRMSVNRSAESMTIVAIACAGLFPVIHLGRIAYLHYIVPIPTQSSLWVNFNSPLVWDIFAISTYFIISLIFWYIGLIPDFALLARRMKKGFRQRIYQKLSLGWKNSLSYWETHHSIIYYLAAIAAPLVISVHSVVSTDFAVTPIPGWHSTIFPPFFVAGAIFSGFAMTQTLIIAMRTAFNLKNFIDSHIVESINKIIIVTGSLVALAYAIEIYTEFASGSEFEKQLTEKKLFGAYAPQFWAMIACNVLIPQLLWIKKIRTHLLMSFLISIVINIGMWLERYVIVVNSLENSLLPAREGCYSISWIEIALFVGSLSFFVLFFMIFTRFAPLIAINEMKAFKGSGHAIDEPDLPLQIDQVEGNILAIYPNAETFKQAYTQLSNKYVITNVSMPNYVEINGGHKTRIPLIALIGGIVGGASAFVFQYWIMTVNNPMVYGGKPYYAFPSFVPVVFECAVLFAGLSMFVAFLLKYRKLSIKQNYFPDELNEYFFIQFLAEKNNENIDFVMKTRALKCY